MIAPLAFPIQAKPLEQPQENGLRPKLSKPSQEHDAKGARRTLRTLITRVHDLMNMTFSGDDEYLVLSCAEHATRNLALELHDKFLEERTIQAVLVAYGQVNTSKDGYIVIRWCGSVPETFFNKLDADEDVIFYTAFPAGPLDTCVAPWQAQSNA